MLPAPSTSPDWISTDAGSIAVSLINNVDQQGDTVTLYTNDGRAPSIKFDTIAEAEAYAADMDYWVQNPSYVSNLPGITTIDVTGSNGTNYGDTSGTPIPHTNTATGHVTITGIYFVRTAKISIGGYQLPTVWVNATTLTVYLAGIGATLGAGSFSVDYVDDFGSTTAWIGSLIIS